MSSTLVMKYLSLFTWSGRLEDDPTVKDQADVKISETNMVVTTKPIKDSCEGYMVG